MCSYDILYYSISDRKIILFALYRRHRINSIFNTNNQKKKFDDLCQRKFGKNRIKPFKDLTNEETISAVKKIISNEYSFLKENIDRQ